MKLLSLVLAASLAVVPIAAADATVYVVDARLNSSTGGTGLQTVTLLAGQQFTVTASTSDLWSAGDIPRYSDANGLIVTRYAALTDDSGPPGAIIGTTLIGANTILWTQNGFTAPFGSLVGVVGNEFRVIGTNFSGSFSQAGILNLYYWDQNNSDNSGTVAANIVIPQGAAVPEPGTWMMMLLGFGGIGLALRRRRTLVVAARD